MVQFDGEIEKEVGVFLSGCRTAALATVDVQGDPHAVNLQYVSDEAWNMFWVSSAKSSHSRHIEAQPRAALCVYAHQDLPELIHGVQFHGRVDLVISQGQSEWHRVWDLYTQKFHQVASVPQLRSAAEKQSFYRFTPTWVRWIDNRRGFGWKAEKQMEDDAPQGGAGSFQI